MKHLLYILPVFLASHCHGQFLSDSTLKSKGIRGGGIQFAYNTERALNFGVNFQYRRQIFSLDYMWQTNSKLGKTKGTQLGNYGQKGAGSGNYFEGVTFGYGYALSRKLGLFVEGTLGADKTYQNYSDRRFKAGGYNIIIYKEGAYGWGGSVRYSFYKSCFAQIGYNTLTGVKIGAMFTVIKDKNE